MKFSNMITWYSDYNTGEKYYWYSTQIFESAAKTIEGIKILRGYDKPSEVFEEGLKLLNDCVHEEMKGNRPVFLPEHIAEKLKNDPELLNLLESDELVSWLKPLGMKKNN